MQSSYSVIKNNSVLEGKEKKINTEYDTAAKKRISEDDMLPNTVEIIESYKNIGDSILQNAYSQKEKILEGVYQKALDIEKEAYEKGYNEGLQNGHEDGYKESYEKYIEIAHDEGNTIKENASEILFNAKKQYEEYMEEKKQAILGLVYNMAYELLEKELIKDDGINHFIDMAIEKSRDCKTFIIKCNECHKNSVESQIQIWKNRYALKGEIFVLADNSLEAGNVVVEKENGKIECGIDKALESIKDELL